MELYRRVRKRLAQILRIQKKYDQGRRTLRGGGPACPVLPLRGTPYSLGVVKNMASPTGVG